MRLVKNDPLSNISGPLGLDQRGPNGVDPGRGSGPLRRGQRVQTDWMTDGKAADRAAELAPEPAVAGRNPHHPAAHSGGLFGLALGALGIVFGDIGSSSNAAPSRA